MLNQSLKATEQNAKITAQLRLKQLAKEIATRKWAYHAKDDEKNTCK